MSNFLNFAGNSGVTFKTFTAGTSGDDYPTATTYVLDKSASTNSVLVSVGGVLQKPGTDYSVSGTTLTTTSTVTTGIVIDTYIIHDAGNAPVIEDNSVTRGKLDLVSTSSAPGATIKGDGTTDGYIQLNCSQNSHGIKLKSPAHSAGASYTLTFPTTDGNANEFLQTNGSGVMTWAEAGGGLVKQIQSVSVDQDRSTTSTSRADITDLTVTVTGLISSDKVLLTGVVSLGQGTSTYHSFVHLDRGGTEIGQGASQGSRRRVHTGANPTNNVVTGVSINYLDSPSATGSVVYKVQFSTESSGTAYINRSGTDSNNNNYMRAVSTLTALVIDGS